VLVASDVRVAPYAGHTPRCRCGVPSSVARRPARTLSATGLERVLLRLVALWK
jgi:hypothetical protein